jgi:DNA-directed RNA polymerase specialized sigma24 family protein
LPPVQQRVFLDHVVEGYTPREIAQKAGRAESTMRRNLHDARQSLSDRSPDDEKQ